MPVPSTVNLTAVFDPGTNVNCWTQLTRAVHPNNGDNVRCLDDETGANLTLVSTSDGTRPTYANPAINNLGAIDFAAGLFLQATNLPATVNVLSASFITVSAYTYFIGINTATAQANANPYDCGGPFTDGLAYWGCSPSLNGGTLHFNAWHFDAGGIKVVSRPLPVGGNAVVYVSFDGATLRLGINQGIEDTTAAGNINSTLNDVVNIVYVGRNYNNAASYPGLLGGARFYNAFLSGAALTNTYQYMMDRWVLTPTPPGAGGNYDQAALGGMLPRTDVNAALG